MSEDILYPRLFIAGCIASLVVMLGAGPAITPVRAQGSKPDVAARKTAEADPDLAVVRDLLGALPATVETASKASPSEVFGFERGLWMLPTSWCVTRLGLPKDEPLEECMVRAVSGRRVAVVITVKECEPEHCEVDYWILSGRSGLRPSPIGLHRELVASPDNKYLFSGHTGMGQDGYTAHLVRINLDTLETRHVAECAAPTLSPSGRWLVCRDASGHVHRRPIHGGRLERVHTIDLGEEVIYSDPHIGVNLPPVQFIEKNRMRIVTLTADGTEDVEEAKWVDGPYPSRR